MDLQQELTRLTDAHRLGGEALADVLRALAREAAIGGGKFDTTVVDRYQGEVFRLARLYAAGKATEGMTAYAEHGELETLLALIHNGRALSTLLAELPQLALRLPEGGQSARAFANDESALQAVAATTGSGFTSRVWEALREYQTDGADGLDSEHRMLRDSFRAFAKKHVAPMAEALHRENRLIPDDLISGVSELGCFGVSIPQRYGGFQEEPDHLGMVVVTEELSRGALIVGSLVTRPEILAKALLKGGTEAQREKYLPLMASGEKMVSISVTEPDYGSDVASISTTATLTEGGWRINGAKLFATFAGRAELVGLLVRTEPDPALGHRGLSMFVLEKPAFTGESFDYTPPGGGRLTGRAIPTPGYRGMHSFELHFEDFFVPAENLVGEESGRGKGFYLQMEAFAAGRLQTAGRALGVMQSAYERAREYAVNRTVFGKPLDAYPLTRERLTDMAATIQAARQLAYATARLMDQGGGQVEASMAKFLLCSQAERVTRDAQQMHGAMGYAEEGAAARLFIDARVLSIFEGTEEVLALKVIAPELLRRHQ